MKPDDAVWQFGRRNDERARDWSASSLLLAVVGLGLARVLVETYFLAFLDTPERWAEGLSGIVWRGAAIGMIAVGMDVHSAVLRSETRAIWTMFPVPAEAVVRLDLRGVAARACLGLLVGQLLTARLALMGWAAAWAWASVAVFTLVAIPVSAVSLLFAVRAALDPRWDGALDAVRGNNPRAQAALIYALAPAIFVLAALAMAAAGQINTSWPTFAGVLASAAALGALALWRLDGLARQAWYPAAQVLTEIDARYALVADPEEARRVGWDWTVRWLPATIGVQALLLLRYAARAERFGGVVWLLLVGQLVLLRSGELSGVAQAGGCAGVAAWVHAVFVWRFVSSTPELLQPWVSSSSSRALAAAWCVAWQSSPLLVMGAFAALVQHGGAGLAAFSVPALFGYVTAALAAATLPGGVRVSVWWAAVAVGVVVAGALGVG